jgi:hypothetical protein
MRLQFEGKGFATAANAARKAEKVVGDNRATRWFVAVQDGRFFPVAVHSNDRDALAPITLAGNGITVV